jgi:hypothetical protein
MPSFGNSGFGGSRKFNSPVSSITEWVNANLQFRHFSVHLGISAPLRPYASSDAMEYSVYLRVAESASVLD